MEEENQQPIPQPEKPKKKVYKKWWFWLILILLLIGIIYFIFEKNISCNVPEKEGDKVCTSIFEYNSEIEKKLFSNCKNTDKFITEYGVIYVAGQCNLPPNIWEADAPSAYYNAEGEFIASCSYYSYTPEWSDDYICQWLMKKGMESE